MAVKKSATSKKAKDLEVGSSKAGEKVKGGALNAYLKLKGEKQGEIK
jgi:hypothetical protein